MTLPAIAYAIPYWSNLQVYKQVHGSVTSRPYKKNRQTDQPTNRPGNEGVALPTMIEYRYSLARKDQRYNFVRSSVKKGYTAKRETFLLGRGDYMRLFSIGPYSLRPLTSVCW